MTASVERARRLLAHSGAWLAAENGAYALRLGPDRRARISLTLDETQFRALIERPGLRRRPQGGWAARGPGATDDDAPAPGRPGFIAGERALIDAEGRMARHAANLGESPIAWLARRKDASGRPWLTPVEVCAGERLRAEVEQARIGPSLTMRWDALPRSGAGSAARVEPGDHVLAAARRVEEALAAVGPRLRPMLTRICVDGDSLRLAETGLGLRRRQGKTLLKQALQALAAHYRIG